MLQKIKHFPYCSSFQLFQVILSMLGFLFCWLIKKKHLPISRLFLIFSTPKNQPWPSTWPCAPNEAQLPWTLVAKGATKTLRQICGVRPSGLRMLERWGCGVGDLQWCYPLVICYIAIENGPNRNNSWFTVYSFIMFYSLPAGNSVTTVDGCEILHQLMVNIPLFCVGFNHPFGGSGFRNHPQ